MSEDGIGFARKVWPKVRDAEVERINQWRARQWADDNDLPRWSCEDKRPPPAAGTGLAISGGGIRSAAFALGALQALDAGLPPEGGRPKGMGRIDYLSTVSGGGYIGTSLIAGMQHLGGGFPFNSDENDKSDPPALGHLRDHSRYLIPGGWNDLVRDLWVVARGLMVNLLFVAGFVLALAGITGIFNPDAEALATPDLFGRPLTGSLQALAPFGTLPLTGLFVAITLATLVAWAICKSGGLSQSETKSAWQTLLTALFWIAAVTALFEVQPLAILRLRHYYAQSPSGWGDAIAWLTSIATVAGPIIALFSRGLEGWLGRTVNASGFRVLFGRFLALALLLVAALILPMLIWLAYLHLSMWTDVTLEKPPALISSLAMHLESWQAMATSSYWLPRRVALFFLLSGGALIGLVWAMWSVAPNAHSLHRLYRDRLGRAFLFAPKSQTSMRTSEPPGDLSAKGFDFLEPQNGPLHLVNAALNLQASRDLNRRGREADFFTFSPAYCGSDATGHIRTETFGAHMPDLATAMAISGAAASSNMGGQSNRLLAPTLSLMNIRLGYWLRNPAHVGRVPEGRTFGDRFRDAGKFHFVTEMVSGLNEKAREVYVTDGGHIENLGLYELLRRRCARIVVIDAECDPDMVFSSLVKVQRFARIDLGVRLSLPWQEIAASHRAAVSPPLAGDGDASPRPCHVASGKIEYPDGLRGTILYLKASLTGDENDYIKDYHRRYPRFPQETTGDQFFSEEQFEAYRALGFHALHGALCGRDRVAGLEVDARPGSARPADADVAGRQLRDLIGWSAKDAP